MAIDPAYRSFVSYIDKSREFYGAHGYDKPYAWAYHSDAPAFTQLPGPLSTLTVGLVTTAFPVGSPGEPRRAKAPYAAPVDPAPQQLFTDDLSWDKQATHTNDPESYLPIARMTEAVQAGRIGRLSPRYYGVPTDYSQRRTVEQDAPALADMIRVDGVDVAVLVPL